MKTSTILFSATSVVDYRFIAEPASIPKETLDLFEKRIRGLLSGNILITEPKWLLDKEIQEGGTFVLWGVACRNSLLSDCYTHDMTKRVIECFIGYIIENPEDSLSLPFDVSAFVSPFNDIMRSKWEDYDQSVINKLCTIPELPMGLNIRQEYGENLNYDPSKCRIFQKTSISVEELFSEALSSSRSVSIASGVANCYKEVYNPDYESIFNAITLDIGPDVTDINVMHKCIVCNRLEESTINGMCEECYTNAIKPKLQTCAECGREAVILYGDLCKECFEKSKLIRCRKCGSLVEKVTKTWLCPNCYKKERKRQFFFVLLILVLLLSLYVYIR